MAQFYSWFVEKLRNRSLSVAGGQTKLLTFGAIYLGQYRNWKHDPRPLIWCQYSDALFTHGINLHYLNSSDKMWLAKTIYIVKKAGQALDGLTFFKFLKNQRPNIIRTAYRKYHTNLLNMRLVSAGISPLDSIVYTNASDPFIANLNKMIAPTEMQKSIPKITYSPEELRNRVNEALNATPITSRRVATPQPPAAPATGSFGTAPYIK